MVKPPSNHTPHEHELFAWETDIFICVNYFHLIDLNELLFKVLIRFTLQGEYSHFIIIFIVLFHFSYSGLNLNF